MKHKTIVIGLDGATWKNLMPWINARKLKFFEKVIKNGVYGTNITTIPCLTCPAIPSFYTGKTPINTKTFGFRKKNGKIISFKDIKCVPFWDYLSEKNISSLIVGLRTTYPPKIKKGVMISSILTPSEESDFVYPLSEKKYLTGFFGEDMTRYERTTLQKKDREKLLERFIRMLEKRTELIKEYKKQKNFDFELFYIGTSDGVQHRLWNSPQLILKAYQRIENLIQEYIKNEKNVNIIFFSDHGFGESPTKIIYINSFLEKQGYLKYKNKFIAQTYMWAQYKGGWFLQKYLKDHWYPKIFAFLKGKKGKSEFNIDPPETNIKFLKTGATKAYLSQKWGINIIKQNVQNYDKFRENLITKLRNFTDKDGTSVFNEVFKKEDVYENADRYEDIPDIIFLLNEKYEPRAGNNPNIITSRKESYPVEGTHDSQREAIFIAMGPNIKEGSKVENVQIYDIAPTILHLYGVPIPKDIDGRVLMEIFKEDSEPATRNVKYCDNLNTKLLNKFTREIRI